MSFSKKNIQNHFNIDDEMWKELSEEGVIVPPDMEVKGVYEISYAWSEDALQQIEENIEIHKAKNRHDSIGTTVDLIFLNEIKNTFLSFGEREPLQLLQLLGLQQVPYGMKNIYPIEVFKSINGIDFLIGIEGKADRVIKKLKNINHIRPANEHELKNINNIDLQYIIHINDEYIPSLIYTMQNPEVGVDPDVYKSQMSVFEWENAKVRTESMDKKVGRQKKKSLKELSSSSLDIQKKPTNERILSTIEAYLKLPLSKSYEKKLLSNNVKKQSKGSSRKKEKFILERGDRCQIIKNLASILDCKPPEIHSKRRKNPISIEKVGYISIGNERFPYEIDVIPINDAVTIIDDTLDYHEKYPQNIRPRQLKEDYVDKLENLFESFIVEAMVLPGPSIEGTPIVFGKNIVIEGSLRVVALRNSDIALKTKYYDYVFALTGKRGLMVRRLKMPSNKIKNFTKRLSKRTGTVPVRNPIIEDYSVDMDIFSKNPSGIRYEIEDGEKKPIYPTDEDGYPYGAIPIEDAPDFVKNHPTFLPSIKMFEKRYGAKPDYVMPTNAATGLEGVYSGVGEQKQHDYWAAETAKNPYEWIHWYHYAGERGEGKTYTRACVIAADPLTGSIVLLEPPGADCKFTSRGIVG